MKALTAGALAQLIYIPCLTVVACLSVFPAVGGVARAQLAAPSPPQRLSVDLAISEWEGAGDDKLNFLAGPGGLDFDDDGQLYVLDSQNQRIAIFSASGQFTGAFGRGGQGPGEFQFSRRGYLQADLSVLGDRVFVLDAPQRRVHVFRLDGRFLDSFALSGSPRSLSARGPLIAIWDGGISLDDNHPEILIVNSAGEMVQRVAEPLFPVTDTFRRRYNGNFIALGPGGVVAQAYERWPILRFNRPDGPLVEVRLKGELWGDEDLASRAEAGLLAYEAAAQDAPFEDPQTLFLKDIEYSSASQSWYALAARDTVFRLDDSFRVVETLVLEQRDPSGDRTYSLSDIAVSGDASRLCAASGAASIVVCYTLPPR